MAGSVNKVILVGNLGRDPEVRSTQAGDKIVTLSVATSENWKEKSTGERKERTEWHRVVIFNDRLAEVADKYLKKGTKIYVDGALQTRKWTDKSGQEKYTTEVVLQRFRGELTMLDAARAHTENTNDAFYDRETGAVTEAVPARRAPINDLDDDIPFATSDPAFEPYLKRKLVA